MINSKICKLYLVSWLPPDPPPVFWDKANLLTNTSLCSDSSQFLTFYQSLLNSDFFTSVIGSDILMKVFENYIIFLVWAAWVLFNFYLTQKQRFPFMKDLSTAKTLKKYRFQLGNFKYNKTKKQKLKQKLLNQ